MTLPSVTNPAQGSQEQQGSQEKQGQAERTSDRLLLLLKHQGAQCAAQLSEELGLTEQGVRRHLSRLTQAGLIQAHTEKPLGRGRAQQVYRLTEQGEARFPKSYSSLCLDILNHLEAEYGTEAVERVMTARSRAAVQQFHGRWEPEWTLPRRLEELTREFQEAGYSSVLEEEPDCYYLTHRNCPHLSVAREYTELCGSERDLIAGLLLTEVTCESRVATGACGCRYRISKPAASPSEVAH